MAQEGAENGAMAAAACIAGFKAQLVVPAMKADEAVNFYKVAFGAEELKRASHPKRKAEQELPSILCAELKIGSSSRHLASSQVQTPPPSKLQAHDPHLLIFLHRHLFSLHIYIFSPSKLSLTIMGPNALSGVTIPPSLSSAGGCHKQPEVARALSEDHQPPRAHQFPAQEDDGTVPAFSQTVLPSELLVFSLGSMPLPRLPPTPDASTSVPGRPGVSCPWRPRWERLTDRGKGQNSSTFSPFPSLPLSTKSSQRALVCLTTFPLSPPFSLSLCHKPKPSLPVSPPPSQQETPGFGSRVLLPVSRPRRPSVTASARLPTSMHHALVSYDGFQVLPSVSSLPASSAIRDSLSSASGLIPRRPAPLQAIILADPR